MIAIVLLTILVHSPCRDSASHSKCALYVQSRLTSKLQTGGTNAPDRTPLVRYPGHSGNVPFRFIWVDVLVDTIPHRNPVAFAFNTTEAMAYATELLTATKYTPINELLSGRQQWSENWSKWTKLGVALTYYSQSRVVGALSASGESNAQTEDLLRSSRLACARALASAEFQKESSQSDRCYGYLRYLYALASPVALRKREVERVFELFQMRQTLPSMRALVWLTQRAAEEGDMRAEARYRQMLAKSYGKFDWWQCVLDCQQPRGLAVTRSAGAKSNQRPVCELLVQRRRQDAGEGTG